MSDGTQKLWGGRFTGETDPLMHLYNASLPYDYKMYKADLEGTKVYTAGLQKLGLLTETELAKIHEGLAEIKKNGTLTNLSVIQTTRISILRMKDVLVN